jgi:hypothetical protein
MADNKLMCDYFPELPARWHCPNCDINLSAPCVRVRKNDWEPVPEHRCPVCLNAVESLGFTHAIPPFWIRLPLFFSYPVRKYALIHLVVVFLINLLPSLTINVSLLAMPFFEILMMGITIPVAIFILLFFAFRCLNHTARGHLEPPSPIDEYSSLNIFLIIKQIIIYLLAVVLVTGSHALNSTLAIIMTGLVLLLIPASTMVLAITNSMLEALSPSNLSKIIKALGWRYSIFYGLLLFMLACQIFLQSESFIAVHRFFLLPVITFIQSYFTLAMFAMMGYVLYQYHESLGFNRVKEFDNQKLKSVVAGLSDDPFLNEISILLTENLHDVAITRLKAKIYDTSKLAYHQKLHQIFQSSSGYQEEMLQHAPNYLDVIFRSKEPDVTQLQLASGVYQSCLKANPHFYYPNAQIVFNLAKFAQRSGRSSLVRDLLSHFSELFPNNCLIPEACFLLATTLVDHLGDDALAKQLLLFLIDNYPEHELIPAAQEYLQLAEKLERKC